MEEMDKFFNGNVRIVNIEDQDRLPVEKALSSGKKTANLNEDIHHKNQDNISGIRSTTTPRLTYSPNTSTSDNPNMFFGLISGFNRVKKMFHNTSSNASEISSSYTSSGYHSKKLSKQPNQGKEEKLPTSSKFLSPKKLQSHPSVPEDLSNIQGTPFTSSVVVSDSTNSSNIQSQSQSESEPKLQSITNNIDQSTSQKVSQSPTKYFQIQHNHLQFSDLLLPGTSNYKPESESRPILHRKNPALNNSNASDNYSNNISSLTKSKKKKTYDGLTPRRIRKNNNSQEDEGNLDEFGNFSTNDNTEIKEQPKRIINNFRNVSSKNNKKVLHESLTDPSSSNGNTLIRDISNSGLRTISSHKLGKFSEPKNFKSEIIGINTKMNIGTGGLFDADDDPTYNISTQKNVISNASKFTPSVKLGEKKDDASINIGCSSPIPLIGKKDKNLKDMRTQLPPNLFKVEKNKRVRNRKPINISMKDSISRKTQLIPDSKVKQLEQLKLKSTGYINEKVNDQRIGLKEKDNGESKYMLLADDVSSGEEVINKVNSLKKIPVTTFTEKQKIIINLSDSNSELGTIEKNKSLRNTKPKNILTKTSTPSDHPISDSINAQQTEQILNCPVKSDNEVLTNPVDTSNVGMIFKTSAQKLSNNKPKDTTNKKCLKLVDKKEFTKNIMNNSNRNNKIDGNIKCNDETEFDKDENGIDDKIVSNSNLAPKNTKSGLALANEYASHLDSENDLNGNSLSNNSKLYSEKVNMKFFPKNTPIHIPEGEDDSNDNVLCKQAITADQNSNNDSNNESLINSERNATCLDNKLQVVDLPISNNSLKNITSASTLSQNSVSENNSPANSKIPLNHHLNDLAVAATDSSHSDLSESHEIINEGSNVPNDDANDVMFDTQAFNKMLEDFEADESLDSDESSNVIINNTKNSNLAKNHSEFIKDEIPANGKSFQSIKERNSNTKNVIFDTQAPNDLLHDTEVIPTFCNAPVNEDTEENATIDHLLRISEIINSEKNADQKENKDSYHSHLFVTDSSDSQDELPQSSFKTRSKTFNAIVDDDDEKEKEAIVINTIKRKQQLSKKLEKRVKVKRKQMYNQYDAYSDNDSIIDSSDSSNDSFKSAGEEIISDSKETVDHSGIPIKSPKVVKFIAGSNQIEYDSSFDSGDELEKYEKILNEKRKREKINRAHKEATTKEKHKPTRNIKTFKKGRRSDLRNLEYNSRGKYHASGSKVDVINLDSDEDEEGEDEEGEDEEGEDEEGEDEEGEDEEGEDEEDEDEEDNEAEDKRIPSVEENLAEREHKAITKSNILMVSNSKQNSAELKIHNIKEEEEEEEDNLFQIRPAKKKKKTIIPESESGSESESVIDFKSTKSMISSRNKKKEKKERKKLKIKRSLDFVNSIGLEHLNKRLKVGQEQKLKLKPEKSKTKRQLDKIKNDELEREKKHQFNKANIIVLDDD